MDGTNYILYYWDFFFQIMECSDEILIYIGCQKIMNSTNCDILYNWDFLSLSTID